MKNEIRNLLGIIIFAFVGCTPVERFNRLVEKHPYLIEKFKKDTVYISKGKVHDTVLVIKETNDTFYFGENRIERFNDTLRFYFRERNCTTYVNKTIYKPSTYVKEESEKKQKGAIHKVIENYVLLGLLSLSLLILLFRK